MGLSYDYFRVEGGGLEGEDYEVKSYAPKLGLQWRIAEQARLRVSAFETTKPTFFYNRTIQPTQVAGLNQFYDDTNGTTSWNYGVGFDTQLARHAYGGLEIIFRDLDEPSPAGRNFTQDVNEQIYRAYAYWAPGLRWVVRFGAEYDVFDSKKPARDWLTEVETLGFPVTVRYFSPTGMFAGFGATAVHQNVKRQDVEDVFAQGDDVFLVADASVGYRFRHRRGLVSVEARNIFDQGFKLQDNNYRTAQAQPNVGPLIPERFVVARLSFNY